MAEHNGHVGWAQFVVSMISILGIIAGLFTWGIGQVSAIDQRSIERDVELKDCIHAYIIPMKEQIAEIAIMLKVHKERTEKTESNVNARAK